MIKYGNTPDEKIEKYISNRFGDLWFVLHQKGYIDVKNILSGTKEEEKILSELKGFFSA